MKYFKLLCVLGPLCFFKIVVSLNCLPFGNTDDYDERDIEGNQKSNVTEKEEIVISPWISDHLIIMESVSSQFNKVDLPKEILFCSVRDCPDLEEFIIRKTREGSSNVIKAEALIDMNLVGIARGFSEKKVKAQAAWNALQNLKKCCYYIEVKRSYFGTGGQFPRFLKARDRFGFPFNRSQIYRVVFSREIQNMGDFHKVFKQFKTSNFEDLFFLDDFTEQERDIACKLADDRRLVVRRFGNGSVCVHKKVRPKQVLMELMSTPSKENEKYKLIIPPTKLLEGGAGEYFETGNESEARHSLQNQRFSRYSHDYPLDTSSSTQDQRWPMGSQEFSQPRWQERDNVNFSQGLSDEEFQDEGYSYEQRTNIPVDKEKAPSWILNYIASTEKNKQMKKNPQANSQYQKSKLDTRVETSNFSGTNRNFPAQGSCQNLPQPVMGGEMGSNNQAFDHQNEHYSKTPDSKCAGSAFSGNDRQNPQANSQYQKSKLDTRVETSNFSGTNRNFPAQGSCQNLPQPVMGGEMGSNNQAFDRQNEYYSKTPDSKSAGSAFSGNDRLEQLWKKYHQSDSQDQKNPREDMSSSSNTLKSPETTFGRETTEQRSSSSSNHLESWRDNNQTLDFIKYGIKRGPYDYDQQEQSKNNQSLGTVSHYDDPMGWGINKPNDTSAKNVDYSGTRQPNISESDLGNRGLSMQPEPWNSESRQKNLNESEPRSFASSGRTMEQHFDMKLNPKTENGNKNQGFGIRNLFDTSSSAGWSGNKLPDFRDSITRHDWYERGKKRSFDEGPGLVIRDESGNLTDSTIPYGGTTNMKKEEESSNLSKTFDYSKLFDSRSKPLQNTNPFWSRESKQQNDQRPKTDFGRKPSDEGPGLATRDESGNLTDSTIPYGGTTNAKKEEESSNLSKTFDYSKLFDSRSKPLQNTNPFWSRESKQQNDQRPKTDFGGKPSDEGPGLATRDESGNLTDSTIPYGGTTNAKKEEESSNLSKTFDYSKLFDSRSKPLQNTNQFWSRETKQQNDQRPKTDFGGKPSDEGPGLATRDESGNLTDSTIPYGGTTNAKKEEESSNLSKTFDYSKLFDSRSKPLQNTNPFWSRESKQQNDQRPKTDFGGKPSDEGPGLATRDESGNLTDSTIPYGGTTNVKKEEESSNLSKTFDYSKLFDSRSKPLQNTNPFWSRDSKQQNDQRPKADFGGKPDFSKLFDGVGSQGSSGPSRSLFQPAPPAPPMPLNKNQQFKKRGHRFNKINKYGNGSR